MNTRKFLMIVFMTAAVCVASAGMGAAVDASVTITDAPTLLPKSMSHSYYSPGLEIGYNGLQTKSYTLKMWLLERTNWNCASSQICEKTITIDNTAGDNPSGTIYIKEVINIYNYNTFDWVVRLYDGGTEVSYAERYATGTSNRPPQLAQIGDKTAFKNSHLEFTISGTDPESDGLTYSANNLPAGASFDSSTGTFSWTPTTTGNYSNIRFRVTDNGEGNLYDSEYITITVLEPEPQLSITPCSLDFGSKATSLTFNVTNTGEGTLDWVVTDDQDWITVSPTSGSTASEVDIITVTVDRIVLASGSYSGTVNITSNAGNQDISISMTVMELPPVKGVCYGPFRDGQSPHGVPYPSENEIREDMSILKSAWAISIRTYGVSNGLDKIIPLANEFDLNVSAGAWLDSNLISNEEEINTLTDLAQNHDIETVIVGNEVVLSYECGWDTLTKAELIEYTTRVKENVSVPVSTGEPWHIWNDDANSDLVDAVDYILIHVHPYWEGIPIDSASDYVIDRCNEIQNKYPHKEVVIGEAGWPSDGSPNGEAVPSLENQKRFMEELLDLADEEGIRIYYFEAFDEKWKEESDVGPHWGLYYSNRTCKHSSNPSPYLVFAITPNSRLAQIGTPVTIFMSVINAGTGNATSVSISQASGLAATIGYQAWDGATLTGSPDTPVDIPAGEAAHFVLTINATAEFASSPMTFDVSGTNAAAAPISSVNTLTISASATPYADVIMMSTSLDVSTAVNTATAFAIATTNVGGAEATGVSLIMEVPSTISGLAYQVNETNPDGTIKGPAAGLTIPVGGQPTFAVFLTPTQAIDYDPANNRIVLKLVDGSGKVVGAQSVAVAAA